MTEEVLKEPTSFTSMILSIEGEEGARISRIWWLLNNDCFWDCCIACKRKLLRKTCCFLMPRDCFFTDYQPENPKYKFQAFHFDPLVLEVLAVCLWYVTLLDHEPCWLEWDGRPFCDHWRGKTKKDTYKLRNRVIIGAKSL